jgi:Protein of unknown function, DUF547
MKEHSRQKHTLKKTIQITISLCAGLFFTACTIVSDPSLTIVPLSPPPYDAWTRVLEKYVDSQGRINFSGIAQDRADLDRFVSYIYAIGPNNHPELFSSRAEVIAFHINAYNALAMYKVVKQAIPKTLAGFRKVSFFFFGKIKVGGETISLYDYENKVIRGLGENRVHFALNCMSVGCPRLPREVFVAEKLDMQLNREATIFFNEARNLQVDNTTQTFKVSEILKFYTEDFLSDSASLAVYVNRYTKVKVPESYKISFITYDWTINRQ